MVDLELSQLKMLPTKSSFIMMRILIISYLMWLIIFMALNDYQIFRSKNQTFKTKYKVCKPILDVMMFFMA